VALHEPQGAVTDSHEVEEMIRGAGEKFFGSVWKQLSVCIALAVVFSADLAAAGRNDQAELQKTYVAVAKKAMPAVVTVNAMIHRGGYSEPLGVGSGFLVTENGFIVTNYHVIRGADRLVVKMYDGKTVRAEVTGVSKRADLAVLKIPTKGKLPFLRFADTDKVEIGHCAIAIGSPFSLSQTMTTGIVSFKGRELGLHYKENYIQTDAAINPGNSGGPLLNLSGEVIGVNDCMISPGVKNGAAGSVGIGFAIDGNLARIVVLSIIKSKLPERPCLGVVMKEFDKDSPPVLAEVLEGSPAAAAGLKPGDRILKIGRRKVSTVWDVQTAVLALYEPGDVASITFSRNGKVLKTKLKVGATK